MIINYTSELHYCLCNGFKKMVSYNRLGRKYKGVFAISTYLLVLIVIF
jgi:hypothetical protein